MIRNRRSIRRKYLRDRYNIRIFKILKKISPLVSFIKRAMKRGITSANLLVDSKDIKVSPLSQSSEIIYIAGVSYHDQK